MFEHKYIISAVLIASIGFGYTVNNDPEGSSAPDSKPIPPYDELKLALRWARSQCCFRNPLDLTNADCAKCNERQIKEEWTIHGLWASDSTGKFQLSYCFNPIKMIVFERYPPSLLNDMQEHWPTVSGDARVKPFWWYQWHKHGTCLRDIQGMESHRNYFNKTMQLYHSYNVEGMLMQGLIFQKNEYTVEEIITAINASLTKIPMLTCNNPGGVSHLYGIAICFDKEFNVKDCPSRTYCKSPVYIP